ncbi:ATP-dependent helicase HrpB [Silvibacterium dinghuense]|uniref:ATP-dependent helicase HrpB n=1 Tax=Silvibacterium dinghuense TaxID=1560006 RepID=UPI001E552812|nr:ATP-dependent helicase HrpB [Silvibacterium dinghuense]
MSTRKSLSLPVDAILPAIVSSLERHPNLIVQAHPGAGKTTRIPAHLLSVTRGEVLVLEPRRIAARMAARQVAREMGEPVGETVGYQVRFEEKSGPKTRLRFLTEGILTRRLLSDPTLRAVDVVVLDEFHERHIEGDLALAMLRQLQQRRPELKLVVMSATLETKGLSEFLDGAPLLHSEGRTFPVTVEHLPYSAQPLEAQVRNAVEKLMAEGHDGSILVFLPGVAEIRRAMRECEAVVRKHDLLALPLYGGLSPEEQDLAVAPSPRQKVIFATNVAESSVTVAGVTAVIDSGLARVASHSIWTGLPTLAVARVSRASATQRAGRAGRTAPGRVLRLYPEEDFLRRAEFDTPEILRSDLSQLCLALRAAPSEAVRGLQWLDAPPEVAVRQAEALLDRLGAQGEPAKEMARYPLAPRLAKLVMASLQAGAGEEGCLAAAVLASDVRSRRTDLLEAMDELRSNPQVRQQLEQIRRVARPPRQLEKHDDALRRAVLAAFPDRVARRRSGRLVQLSMGGLAELAGDDAIHEFLVAVEAEDRKDKALPGIRMVSAIEPDWLLDLFPERVTERNTVEWVASGERVESVSTLLYDDLVMDETRGAKVEEQAASALLVKKAVEAGLAPFVDADALEALLARIEFAGLEPPDVEGTLRELCAGLRSFSQLRTAAKDLLPLLEQQAGSQRLQSLAPHSIRLQGGRQTRVHYERGKPPWIASRLQDFFGMKETPRIGPAQTPVVIHLLAPNQRAVQTTADLAGFWQRLYPQVRRELMRRYPRHAWPETP